MAADDTFVGVDGDQLIVNGVDIGAGLAAVEATVATATDAATNEVTGVHASNTALESLLTVLATAGIITDSTTAS